MPEMKFYDSNGRELSPEELERNWKEYFYGAKFPDEFDCGRVFPDIDGMVEYTTGLYLNGPPLEEEFEDPPDPW